jgi:hypothetical protein
MNSYYNLDIRSYLEIAAHEIVLYSLIKHRYVMILIVFHSSMAFCVHELLHNAAKQMFKIQSFGAFVIKER